MEDEGPITAEEAEEVLQEIRERATSPGFAEDVAKVENRVRRHTDLPREGEMDEGEN